MENNKPTYDQVETELNEYKELLWQLSDEYKLNMGTAEKKLEEEKDKYIELEEKLEQNSNSRTTGNDYISKLGLPACILNKKGELIRYNNKFRFLIELLSIEIEDVTNISKLLSKDKSSKLNQQLNEFLDSDTGLFQSLFRVENSFQGIINLILRVYKPESGDEQLALFVELHKNEIQNLAGEIQKPTPTVEVKANLGQEMDEEMLALKTDVAVFAEKYEVYNNILKLVGGKKNVDKEVDVKELQSNINETFGLKQARSKILEKLKTRYRNFETRTHDKYPDLTSNEEKHCMLIKAGLTYKEIASIMNISINGVKIARNRLRKKLDLENNIKTSDFIDQL